MSRSKDYSLPRKCGHPGNYASDGQCKICSKAQQKSVYVTTGRSKGHPRKCEHGSENRDNQNRCKTCRNEYERNKYDPEKDKLRHAHQTKEDRRLRSENYRRENHDKDLRQKAKWSKAHPEQGRKTTREYRARKFKAEGSFTEDEWLEVVRRQDGKCTHCRECKRLEADHIMPLSKGGGNTISNIQGLCRKCNASKGANLEREPLLKGR